MSPVIESLATAVEGERWRPALVALLQDVVDHGASVGFMPPLAAAEAHAYWTGILGDLDHRVLFIARSGEALLGSVQLALERRANGTHRAEVAKFIVLSSARRQGIGRALMNAAEAAAQAAHRSTLVLDTRLGDPSNELYLSLGWTRAGIIPQYARNPNGEIDPTVIYYKLLGG
jgi:ribosomal protein S18 acetylase RimI-like enzyme